MKLKLNSIVTIIVDEEELDLLIRGLQMIVWQDDIKKGEIDKAEQMKSDLVAMRHQCSCHDER